MWLIAILFCVLQITFVPLFLSFGASLDLVLVLVLSWSMQRTGRDALSLAFFCGLVLSPYTALRFGFLPLFYTLVAFGSSILSREALQYMPWLKILWGLLWCLVFELFILLSYIFSGYPLHIISYLVHVMIARILVNTGMILLMSPFFRLVDRVLNQPKIAGIKNEG